MKCHFLGFLICHMLLSETTASYWSKWSTWSECSRTCDGGAKYQTRRCIRRRSQDFRCTGSGILYSTCNNKACKSGVPDFRSEQCAAYNDASYSGHTFKWLTYHDPVHPCALSCIAEGTQMIAILAPKVLDGTRCYNSTLNMCINGKCVPVGCDHVLHSKVTEDSCGVCGGDNSTCSSNKHVSSERYRWIQTGYGSCSVTCGVGVKDKRLLCFDSYKGRVMDSIHCDSIERPTDTRTTCRPGSCPPGWRVGPWQNCTRDCGGGVSWRVVTCIKTFEDGTQQLMRDSDCDSATRPSSRKSCNGYICPTWYAGEWSVCSVSCGTGVQTREVICRHVGEKFCHVKDKPRTEKKCTTGIPCYDLNGDIQERKVGQLKVSDDIPQGDQAITKEDLFEPRFVTTTWDSCSASCGEGVRFRYVRCQVFLWYLNDFSDLPDEDCNETKPAEYETCMVEPCYDLYEWVPDGMTECSHTCLGGIQESILKCKTKENQTIVDDSLCIEAPHVQTERRICNVKPCPQRWELGDYGECSATCGGGQMSRNVKCIQEYAQGPTILNLPDFMCSQPVPDRVSPCNTIDCPGQWFVGNWSECSVTCGLGVRARLPLCQKIRNEKLVNVSRSECDITLKPDTEMTCNMTSCPEPMIKSRNIKFYQLSELSKVKLIVGMEAKVVPETNIILKCPHVGLDRQKITWFKNGLKFRRSKRARVSKSGALRIRNALPGRDDAIYNCLVGGLEANVSISFGSSFDILQARVYREKFLTGKASKEYSLLNKTVLYTDPVDRVRKPLTLISTDWSRCSVTCGGGLQSRNLSCELITSDYYEVLPKEVCFKASSRKPSMIQSCNTNPCVKWRTGDWSMCSHDDCVRHQYSIERRDVDCVNEFNDSITEATFCSSLGFPPDNIRDCFNPNCTFQWETSRWSKCVSNCDEKGYKTRTLTCVWSGSGQTAPIGSCSTLPQPKTTRKCKGAPCNSLVCEDESEYCSIIYQMNMCHYSNFEQRCCLTCNPDYYDETYYDEADES
ncbi:ADAMTS-like protein 1 isoform X1 [Mercenaria mercenaria]|uniref:ADAMTS-like protein 1 isoform X1 n=1 Tax=Mercenaria mercenaria TaxID=6596 RepID=UPI00234F3235|nr:ADAMTS-like protein 1 isoform X1 [Mercenaria mercenaria]